MQQHVGSYKFISGRTSLSFRSSASAKIWSSLSLFRDDYTFFKAELPREPIKQAGSCTRQGKFSSMPALARVGTFFGGSTTTPPKPSGNGRYLRTAVVQSG